MIKNFFVQFFPRHKWFERFEQFIILLAHLILLKWILYALSSGGTFKTLQVVKHFLGMGLYGSLLIWGTSALSKRRFLKEQKIENQMLASNTQTTQDA